MNIEVTLFDFSDPAAVDNWQSIDDRVMGGVSRSQLRAAQDHAVFEGHVSAENHGGFASTRATLPRTVPADVEYLWLELRGVNRMIYVNLRTDSRFDGLSYRAGLRPGTAWARHNVRFVEFEPVFRGRSVPDAPPLSPAGICQVGLMVADRQWGDFAVEIRALGVS